MTETEFESGPVFFPFFLEFALCESHFISRVKEKSCLSSLFFAKSQTSADDVEEKKKPQEDESTNSQASKEQRRYQIMGNRDRSCGYF